MILPGAGGIVVVVHGAPHPSGRPTLAFRTMNVPRTLLTLFLPSLVAGCLDASARGRSPAREELDHGPLRPRLVRGTVLNASDSLQYPTELAVVGEYLVALNEYRTPVGYLLRRSDGALVRTFGRDGQGPGEFMSAWSVDPVPGADEFWLYDPALRRTTRISVGQVLRGAPAREYPSVQLTSDGVGTDLTWLGDSLMVAPGFFKRGRLGYFDAGGSLLREAGEVPQGSEGTPAHVRQHGYQSTLEPNPSRTLLALGTRHADQIEIYRPDGTRVALGRGPFRFDPRYEVGTRGGQPALAVGDELRFGYVDLAATEDHVFALFSGRRQGDYRGTANLGEYVHVFDWSGRFLAELRLDAPVIHIAVDPGTMTLYASRPDPSPAILKYPLGEGPLTSLPPGPTARTGPHPPG